MRLNMDTSPPSDGPSSDEQPIQESYRRGRKAVSGAAAAVTLVTAAAFAFLRYRPARVAIEGVSMAPTLVPGDWVLVVSPDRFEREDVVVVEHPQRPGYEIVKRIVGVPGDEIGDRVLGADDYWVEGDFAQRSTDSRQFGAVPRSAIKARAVLIYWPLERRRAVR
jgi:nickel-type superoxide dismutase maturation protease